MKATLTSSHLTLAMFILSIGCSLPPAEAQESDSNIEVLECETLDGKSVWQSHQADDLPANRRPIQVKVWFDKQFLGDGQAYQRRAKEFAKSKRRELREQVIATLKHISDESYAAAKSKIDRLVRTRKINRVNRHWIVNGFTCSTTAAELHRLKEIPGVKKIFVTGPAPRAQRGKSAQSKFRMAESVDFTPGQHKNAWYIEALLADKAWTELGARGQGTLNVIHDGNFVMTKFNTGNLYVNEDEIPDNGKDDDGNGCVDDVHGFNFRAGSNQLTTSPNANDGPGLHGTSCAAIVCGTGSEAFPYVLGIAPEGRWAGVIGRDIEECIEWAVEQGADTYSMSFSRPGLGETRSHWRKVMEHGSFCGIFFVSGAGNFAMTEKVPVQMRTPEDIPDVVFAAAGVQRNLTRTPFSSKGPVEWKTNHYQDGRVQKPEVCAFNHGLPLRLPNGNMKPNALNGNSFAGPMFCGSIAILLSADPDLMPWDLKEIITSTASDIGPEGLDYETGHGLINCYRAAREVLRRKAIRDGEDPAQYEGRTNGDELDIAEYRESLSARKFWIFRLNPQGTAAKAGIRQGDLVMTVNGRPISSDEQWNKTFRGRNASGIEIVIRRDGKPKTFNIKGNHGIGRPGVLYKEPVFK